MEKDIGRYQSKFTKLGRENRVETNQYAFTAAHPTAGLAVMRCAGYV